MEASSTLYTIRRIPSGQRHDCASSWRRLLPKGRRRTSGHLGSGPAQKRQWNRLRLHGSREPPTRPRRRPRLTGSMAIAVDLVYSKAKSLLVWREQNLSPRGRSSIPASARRSLRAAWRKGLIARWPALRLASAPWLWRSLVHSGEVRGQHVQHARRKHGYQPVRPRRGRGSLRHRHPSYAGAPWRREPTPGLRGVDHTHRAQRPPYSSHDRAPLPFFTRYEPRNRRRGGDLVSWDISRGPEHSDHEPDLCEGFP